MVGYAQSMSVHNLECESLAEEADGNPAAKSKSSLLPFGAVERKLNLLSQATEITELF
jgi:hypothetical protein